MLATVVVPARFLPKAEVKVGEVAEMPMVVVVVALGGSMGTSGSAGEEECRNVINLILHGERRDKLQLPTSYFNFAHVSTPLIRIDFRDF